MIPLTDYECRLKLNEIYEGHCVILPSSIEHAEAIMRVTQLYIDQQHNETVKLLSKEYK
jgi:hypothetical protein